MMTNDAWVKFVWKTQANIYIEIAAILSNQKLEMCFKLKSDVS